jgi:hypothetical protein
MSHIPVFIILVIPVLTVWRFLFITHVIIFFVYFSSIILLGFVVLFILLNPLILVFVLVRFPPVIVLIRVELFCLRRMTVKTSIEFSI